ncbi:hypothetical protein BACPU_03720 [Bacillus pumilus]|nr:hypothetical protein BACPU_03720 [Bacillus pumilus]
MIYRQKKTIVYVASEMNTFFLIRRKKVFYYKMKEYQEKIEP